MATRLRELYIKNIVPEMMKKFSLKNKNQVPDLEKIVVNCGVGEAKENPKLLTAAAEELGMITGQKAAILKSKKAISNFKIKKGVPIACKVTLRGNRMWEFFDRFVNVALPRLRDFRGVEPNSFDRFNHYTIGIKEQIIFPEIDYDKIDKIKGMNIVIVTSAKSDDEARYLLKLMGMPFRN